MKSQNINQHGTVSPQSLAVKQKKSRGKALSLVLLALILIAGAAVGTYFWQHQKVRSLYNQTDSLNARISVLNIKVANLNKQLEDYKDAFASTITSTGSTQINITQMGIELTAPSNLTNLTYHYSTNDPVGSTPISGETFADLSSATLDSKYSSCIADSNQDSAKGTAYGMLVKGTGTGKGGENFQVLKQFTGFYIAYASPQAICTYPGGNVSNFFNADLSNITITQT